MMKVTLATQKAAAARVDMLVVAASPRWKSEELGEIDRRTKGALAAEIRRQGFKAAPGNAAIFQTHGTVPSRYVLVVGIGATNGSVAWYKLAHHAVTRARGRQERSAAIAIPPGRLDLIAVEAVTEGLSLSSYTFDRMKSTPRRRTALQTVRLLVPRSSAPLRAALSLGRTIATATCYARDIVNLPAAIVTPRYLANEAKRIARAQRLKAR